MARREIKGLIHHSDRGCQCSSIRYTEHLVEANIEASVGSIGDSYDNALAEQLTDYTKPRLFGIAVHGAILMMWSLQPWKGRLV